MFYELFSFALAGVVIGLLIERRKLMREANQAKTIAAIMFAEKMGLKIGGKDVQVEIVDGDEMDEIIKKEKNV